MKYIWATVYIHKVLHGEIQLPECISKHSCSAAQKMAAIILNSCDVEKTGKP